MIYTTLCNSALPQITTPDPSYAGGRVAPELPPPPPDETSHCIAPKQATHQYITPSIQSPNRPPLPQQRHLSLSSRGGARRCTTYIASGQGPVPRAWGWAATWWGPCIYKLACLLLSSFCICTVLLPVGFYWAHICLSRIARQTVWSCLEPTMHASLHTLT